MLKVFTNCFQICKTPMDIISCLNRRTSAVSIPIAMIIIAFVRIAFLKIKQRPNLCMFKKTTSEVYNAKHMFLIMAACKSTIIEAHLKYTKPIILWHECPVSFEPSEREYSNSDRIG